MRKTIAFLVFFVVSGFASADTYPANLSYYGQSFFSGAPGQPAILLYAYSPAGVCDALLAEVKTKYPGCDCGTGYFTASPNCHLFRNSDHGGLGYRDVGSTYTCPSGGNLSGTSCINAPACATSQTRNATTGACESSLAGIPLRNTGKPPVCSCAGNPINIGTGNKYQSETDYQGAGDFPRVFERTYNSDASTVSERFGTGSGWRHSYERSIAGGRRQSATQPQ